MRSARHPASAFGEVGQAYGRQCESTSWSCLAREFQLKSILLGTMGKAKEADECRSRKVQKRSCFFCSGSRQESLHRVVRL